MTRTEDKTKREENEKGLDEGKESDSKEQRGKGKESVNEKEGEDCKCRAK